MNIAIFTLNAFSENTYILYDDTKDCVIVDPGCSNPAEEQELVSFIETNGLTPVRLLNTHCHIDHVLGNKFISDKYGLKLEAHKIEEVVLAAAPMSSQIYSIPYTTSPEIEVFLDETQQVTFGNTTLDILFTPGHSPGSISFFHKESKQLIAGDVLFQGSIGRTDLPGGDYDTLITSIKTQYFPLGDEVRAYPGHGPSTTIGEERVSNPFLV